MFLTYLLRASVRVETPLSAALVQKLNAFYGLCSFAARGVCKSGVPGRSGGEKSDSTLRVGCLKHGDAVPF